MDGGWLGGVDMCVGGSRVGGLRGRSEGLCVSVAVAVFCCCGCCGGCGGGGQVKGLSVPERDKPASFFPYTGCGVGVCFEGGFQTSQNGRVLGQTSTRDTTRSQSGLARTLCKVETFTV